VVGVGQREDAAAVCLGAGDAQLHRLHPHHLAEAVLAVERHQRADVGVDLDAGVGHQPAFGNGIDVTRQHAHAVGVVPAEVGQHQVGGHLFGLGRRTAGCYQYTSAMRL